MAGGPAPCQRRRIAALVADTYARARRDDQRGQAGGVELLPPENILVRFFVPETALATIHPASG